MPVVHQGFLIYGQAPGKLISCEVDFARLVWPSKGKFFLKKSLVQ